MSISTYSELKSTIADFLNRDDLTSVIPTFVSLAEADIARKLRHWRNEKRVTASLNERYEFLPSDWLGTVKFEHADGTEIRLVSAATMSDLWARQPSAGKPTSYRVSADQISLHPEPAENYEAVLTYHGKVPALSDAAPTNWLLTNDPGVLLYGALMHAAPYLQDDARVSVWGALYAASIEGLNADGERAKHSGPLVMRVRGA